MKRFGLFLLLVFFALPVFGIVQIGGSSGGNCENTACSLGGDDVWTNAANITGGDLPVGRLAELFATSNYWNAPQLFTEDVYFGKDLNSIGYGSINLITPSSTTKDVFTVSSQAAPSLRQLTITQTAGDDVYLNISSDASHQIETNTASGSNIFDVGNENIISYVPHKFQNKIDLLANYYLEINGDVGTQIGGNSDRYGVIDYEASIDHNFMIGNTHVLDVNLSGAGLNGRELFDANRVQSQTFKSTIATGTAPLTVASTTKVTNLNADLLDGLHVATSGTAIGALNAANTWGATQTLNGGARFGLIDQDGYIWTVTSTDTDTGVQVFGANSFSLTAGGVERIGLSANITTLAADIQAGFLDMTDGASLSSGNLAVSGGGNIYGAHDINADNLSAGVRMCLQNDCRTAWPASGISEADANANYVKLTPNTGQLISGGYDLNINTPLIIDNNAVQFKSGFFIERVGNAATAQKITGLRNEYLGFVLGSKDGGPSWNGGMMGGGRKDGTKMPYPLFNAWDDGNERALYVGGGGWSAPAATRLYFYISSSYALDCDKNVSSCGTFPSGDFEALHIEQGEFSIQAGTSFSKDADVGGTLANKTIDTNNTTTTETSLWSSNIDANVLSTTNDNIHFVLAGTMLSNANTKELKVTFGSATLLDTGANADCGTDWVIEGRIFKTATDQEAITQISDNNVLSSCNFVAYSTAAETLTSAVALALTGQSSADTGDITFRMGKIFWEPSS